MVVAVHGDGNRLPVAFEDLTHPGVDRSEVQGDAGDGDVIAGPCRMHRKIAVVDVPVGRSAQIRIIDDETRSGGRLHPWPLCADLAQEMDQWQQCDEAALGEPVAKRLIRIELVGSGGGDVAGETIGVASKYPEGRPAATSKGAIAVFDRKFVESAGHCIAEASATQTRVHELVVGQRDQAWMCRPPPWPSPHWGKVIISREGEMQRWAAGIGH